MEINEEAICGERRTGRTTRALDALAAAVAAHENAWGAYIGVTHVATRSAEAFARKRMGAKAGQLVFISPREVDWAVRGRVFDAVVFDDYDLWGYALVDRIETAILPCLADGGRLIKVRVVLASLGGSL